MSVSVVAAVPQFNPSQTPQMRSGSFPLSVATLMQQRAAAPTEVTVDPAPGRVKSLKSFNITFTDAESVTQGSVTYANAATVHRTGDPDDSKQYCFGMAFDGNVMTLSVSSEITGEGDWTLTMPAGFYLIDGAESTETLEFDYTIATVEIAEGEIIYEAPVGEKVECMTNVLAWAVVSGGLMGMPFAGKPMHYILSDDGCIYVYNAVVLSPFSGRQMNTYIKGIKDGDDYLFTFPQPIYEESVEGGTQTWFLNRLKKVRDDEDHSTYVLADDNTLRMKINADGSLETSQPLDADIDLIGTLVNDEWNGFGNLKMRYDVANFVAAEPPADLETADAEMKYIDAENQSRTSYLKVGISGNDVWIKGLGMEAVPEAWAHGVINGNSVTFDTYMGLSEIYGQYVFLFGCDYEGTPVEESIGLVTPEFTFDRENMSMSCNSNLCLNANNWFYYGFHQFQQCVISFVTDDPNLTTRVPSTPAAVRTFEPTDGAQGEYKISVEITNLNTDGQPLNEDKLSYQIILADESVYTFQPYRYPLSMPMTDIPFTTDYDFIEVDSNIRSFSLYDVTDGSDIGVRMVYRDATGTYYSDIRWFIKAGVEDADIDKQSVSTVWFDLTGRRVLDPSNGIYIRCERDSNGNQTTSKVIMR